MSQLVMYRSFEVPKNTSKEAKKVLSRLNKNGFVTVSHDDGPGINTRTELRNIAGAVGLMFYALNPYEYMLMTDEFFERHLVKIY